MSDLVETEKQEITTSNPVSESNAIISVIERAALNPDVDVEKMERLYEMKEKIDAKNAEVLFNLAMNQAQSEMGRVSADATNNQTRSNYATYGKLDKVLRPIYSRHGFSLSFDTGTQQRDNSEHIICYVSHSGGHTRQYTIDVDSSGKGAKGGDVMTKTHATGSAMSYGMRYLLKMIFNVAIGAEDDDGNAAGSQTEYITEEMVNLLDSKLVEHEIDRKKFNSWLKRDLKIDSLEQLSMKAYRTVEARINSAIRAKNKEKK